MRLKLKIAGKINLMFIVTILIFAISLGLILNNKIRSGIEEFAIEKAKSDIALSYKYIDLLYPGEWAIKGNHLYKGEQKLNGYFDLVDEIGKDTGGTITIFQNNTRIATNILIDGQRAVGTTVSEVVQTAVLENKQNYFGEANVQGTIYQAAYQPLFDVNNNAIGMLYIGAPQDIIDKIIGSILKNTVVVFTIVLVLALLSITLFSNNINKRLKNIVEVVKDAGNGHFKKKLVDNSTDELASVADSFNEMTHKLKDLIVNADSSAKNVEHTTNNLQNASNNNTESNNLIASDIHQITSNLEQQLNTIEQTVTAVNELTAGINHVAENATQVAEASSESIQKAKNGSQNMESLTQQMQSISASNTVSNNVLLDLELRSKEIGKIIDAISNISTQTNLLSLNAAIEAARAGEHGKSFAVVADEVRNLSVQTKDSTVLIANIVEAIQEDTLNLVKMMNNTNEEISNGLISVQNTGNTFEEIVMSIELSNAGIQELSAISEEMSASMEEINATIENIADLSKHTTDGAKNILNNVDQQKNITMEVENITLQLTKEAKQLEEVLNKFNI